MALALRQSTTEPTIQVRRERGLLISLVIGVGSLVGLLSIDNPYVKNSLALMATASVGYAVSEINRELADRDTLAEIDRVMEQLENANQDVHKWMTRSHDLSKSNRELEQARDDLNTSLTRSETTITQLRAAIAVEVQQRDLLTVQFNQRFNGAVAAKTAELTAELKRARALTNSYRAVWVADVASYQTAHNAAMTRLDNDWEALHNSAMEDLEQMLDAAQKAIEELPRRYELAIENGRAELRMLREENDRLSQTIREYQRPKTLDASNSAAFNATRLVNFYMDKGLAVDALNAKRYGVFDDVWLKPRTGTTLNDLKTHGDEIQLSFELTDVPEFTVDRGSVRVRLFVDEPVTESERTTLKGDTKPRIIEPVPTWLKDVLIGTGKDGKAKPNHARFNGESESGKSALVDNAVALIKAEFPGIRVLLADPMGDSGESEWNFEPTWKGDAATAQALEFAVSLIDERKGNPDADRTPTVIIGDEIDTEIADYPDRVLANLKKVWKTGRHVGVYFWAIGQSPYCSTFKLLKGDMRNAVGFYLSSNIPKGLKDLELTNDLESKWLNQYHLRMGEGQLYQVLVAPKQRAAFLAQTPKPGSFAVQTTTADTRLSDAVAACKGGSTVSQAIETHWGLKPSKGKEYQAIKAQLIAVIG